VRRLAVGAAGLVVVALTAGAAGAKEGVEATLLTPIPKEAAPGSTLRVEWRLAELSTGRPFGAGRVFVRLLGPGGTSTTAYADEAPTGRFAANATVPDGGVHGIRIGLQGMSCAASCTYAPMFFRVVNDPFTGPWAPLRRPLHVPTVAYGAACPVARPSRTVDFAALGVTRGIGPGPAFPVGWADGTIPITYGLVDVDARVWGVQKVLWLVRSSYHGPVLVRGGQIDGPYKVRFERGRVPAAELRIPAGVRERPSYVRIRKPGCYAFQIDGLTFSRTIVFRAVRGY
jgi:hypothetical protein